MALTDEQLVGRGVRQRLVRMVRDSAGAFPGEEVLDLGSPDGFLARGLARESPRWTLYSPEARSNEDNLVPVRLVGSRLPFADKQVAAAVAAFVDDRPSRLSAALVRDLYRVLAPRGRILLLGRSATSRAPDVQRTVPEEAAAWLTEAGFGRVANRRIMHLADGSEVSLLEATKPL